jgi:hypothetical protein
VQHEIRDLAYVAYSTHSCYAHGPSDLRLRLIFPITASCPAEEFKARYEAFASERGFLRFCDPGVKDPTRFFYEPSHRPGVTPILVMHDGAALDWSKIAPVSGRATRSHAGSTTADVMPPAGELPEMGEYDRVIMSHLKTKAAALKHLTSSGKDARLLISRVIAQQPVWAGSGCDAAGIETASLLGTIMPVIPGTATPFPVDWAEKLLAIPLRSMDCSGAANPTSGPAIWEKCGRKFEDAREIELENRRKAASFRARLAGVKEAGTKHFKNTSQLKHLWKIKGAK